MNDDVHALITWDADGDGSQAARLIATGEFTTAFNAKASGLAAWDGIRWTEVGGGIRNLNSPAGRALTIHRGKLVVAGNFGFAAEQPDHRCIATWDGERWDSLAGGLAGTVYAVTVFDDEIIAGGVFSESRAGEPISMIARWDGVRWSTLGEGLPPREPGAGAVYALCEFNGELLVGGELPTLNGELGHNLRRWDGVSWTSAGMRFSREINSLKVDGDRVIIGGDFRTIDGLPANGVVTWNAGGWQPMARGLTNGTSSIAGVETVHVHGGEIVAAGRFDRAPLAAGSRALESIATWDGQSWGPCGAGVGGIVRALNSFDDRLVAGGIFTRASGVEVGSIATWDGAQWEAFPSRSNDMNFASIVKHNGLWFIGGDIRRIGGVEATNIASWDGETYANVANGLNGVVRDLIVWRGDLYVGGSFTLAGNQRGIARWDGTQFLSVGGGTNGQVISLEIHEGDLVAAGQFTSAGGARALCVAQWDGAGWTALGDDFLSGAIYRLRSHGSKLYAAGTIGITGGTLACWDGERWARVGPYIGQAIDVVIYNDEPHIIGAFSQHGNIARWSNSTWTSLGEGFAGTSEYPVRMEVFKDEVYVSGITRAGGVAVNYLARWNGSEWRDVGGGTDNSAGLLKATENELFVGGIFEIAGPYAQTGLARWSADGKPWFATIPVDTQGRVGTTSTIRAIVPPGYDAELQWQIESSPGQWVNLENGVVQGNGLVAEVVGADSSSLRVTFVQHGGPVRARCLARNGQGEAVTPAIAIMGYCASDFNADGFLDFFDYADFVACFEGSGCPSPDPLEADFNADGFVDFFDYSDFVAAFETGC